MSEPVFQILNPGLGVTIQDFGRPGWRRFGVPPGGCMDEHAALWANRLVGNPPTAPVLEMLLQGMRLAVLRETWLAVTGADAGVNVPMWHSVRARVADVLSFPENRSGNWIYVGVAGGFAGDEFLGSVSTYLRGKVGRAYQLGDLLLRAAVSPFRLQDGVASLATPQLERRDYLSPPPLRVWPGPQFEQYDERDRSRFFTQPWRISSQSDRVGFRLDGEPLKSNLPQLISEPVRVGTLQVPENGCPIVTMRDGPTVGGYAKLGVVDPGDLAWLAQCRPGQEVRFQLVT